jgi:aerobic carbon-monoxide dehydrogenase large subunit
MEATGWIGRPRRRVEDERLLTGAGAYVEDVQLPGTAYLALVRSPYAHARIVDIGLEAARRAPGVVDVIDGSATSHLGYIQRNPVLPGTNFPEHPPLTQDKARYVGDEIVAVLAESPYQARDAAALVEIEYEPLPAVIGPEQALAEGAPIVHDAFGSNVAFAGEFGSSAEETGQAFSQAEHVVRLRIAHPRLAPASLETRGILASWDSKAERLEAWMSTQRPNGNRDELATIFSLNPEQIRVICKDVGGAFGSKSMVYREHVLVVYFSLKHARPVRWVATRSEDFQACSAGRGMVTEVEAALTKDGELLALRATVAGDVGAYMHGTSALTTLRVGRILSGAYRVKAARVELKGVFTNAAPIGPYRGAGRPEAALIVERLIDVAARELGIDPLDIRRRNFIQADQFPWKTPNGQEYDSGDYARTLEHALELAGYEELLRWRAAARQRGELAGIGFSTFVEPSAGSGYETGRVRVEPDGAVVAATGSASHGQGHETTFAQIVADRLQVPIERITVLENDTSLTPGGVGTVGSRSTFLGGSALAEASDTVVDKMKRVAANAFEANAADIVYEKGVFQPAGDPTHRLTFAEAAALAYQPNRLPAETQPGLDSTNRYQASSESWGHGSHIAAVKIDRETGKVRLHRVVAVDDAGVVVNPLLAEGQIEGGLAQGVAQALFEEVVYDENGALLTGTFMDYEIPTARELPLFQLGETSSPTPLNPLGAKGLGEAGTVGIPPAIVNAVSDALWDLGVRHIDMPLTPDKVWAAIEAAAG